jgi:hypothetical protein
MAGAGKKTFTAGETLTASDVNTFLMEQSVMVFGGTAARASAIPTASEGMFSYQTDDNTFDAYTGAAWVSLVPQAAVVTTSQTVTSTSYVDLATVGPTVTMRTGTSVLVTVGAWLIANAGTSAFMSFAISGATTLAASDDNCLMYSNESTTTNFGSRTSRQVLVTGLTAGVNTFTTKYRVSAGTGTIALRHISVQPLL